MNVLRRWSGAYRGWEDGYIAMLDALNAGRRLDSDQLAISIKGRDEKVSVSRAFIYLFKD